VDPFTSGLPAHLPLSAGWPAALIPEVETRVHTRLKAEVEKLEAENHEAEEVLRRMADEVAAARAEAMSAAEHAKKEAAAARKATGHVPAPEEVEKDKAHKAAAAALATAAPPAIAPAPAAAAPPPAVGTDAPSEEQEAAVEIKIPSDGKQLKALLEADAESDDPPKWRVLAQYANAVDALEEGMRSALGQARALAADAARAKGDCLAAKMRLEGRKGTAQKLAVAVAKKDELAARARDKFGAASLFEGVDPTLAAQLARLSLEKDLLRARGKELQATLQAWRMLWSFSRSKKKANTERRAREDAVSQRSLSGISAALVHMASDAQGTASQGAAKSGLGAALTAALGDEGGAGGSAEVGDALSFATRSRDLWSKVRYAAGALTEEEGGTQRSRSVASVSKMMSKMSSAGRPPPSRRASDGTRLPSEGSGPARVLEGGATVAVDPGARVTQVDLLSAFDGLSSRRR